MSCILRAAPYRLLAASLAMSCFLLASGPASAQDSGEGSAPCPPYFRDLGPLGGEQPREVAKQFLEGVLEGDRSKVISSFDLRSLESIATAAMYAELAKATALMREVKTRARERFGPEALRVIEDQVGVSFSKSRGFDSPEKVEDLLSEMEVITEGDRSVALFSNPWDEGDPLRMQKIGDRWYLAPPEEMSADDPGAGLAVMFLSAFLQASLPRLQQVEKALEQSESLGKFEDQLKQLGEDEEGLGLFSAGADDSGKPRHPDAMLFFKQDGGSVGTSLGTGAGSSSFDGEGHGVRWSYVGRSEAGDVYVVEIETPRGQKEPEAVIYSGEEKVLYESEDGEARVWIESSETPDFPSNTGGLDVDAAEPKVEVVKPERGS